MKPKRNPFCFLIVCLLSVLALPVFGELHFKGDIVSTPNPAIVPENAPIQFELVNVQIEPEGLPDDEHEPSKQTICWKIVSYQHRAEGAPLEVVHDSGPGVQTRIVNYGHGQYRVIFTAEDDETHESASLHMSFPVVAVDVVECAGASSSTDTPGNKETAVVPVGFGQGTVRVHASPTPYGGWPEGKPVWSGDVLSADGDCAVVDTSVPGMKTVTAACGNQVSLNILVAGVDIMADVNHDGQITADDNAGDGEGGDAELEETAPGLILAMPSQYDTDEDARQRLAPVMLVPKYLAESAKVAAARREPGTGGREPKLSLEFADGILEVYDAPVEGEQIMSGDSLPYYSGLTVYVRGIALPFRGRMTPLTLHYEDDLLNCSDTVMVTILDLTPLMQNGGYLLVNDDNDDMGDGDSPENVQKDLEQTGPVNGIDDDLQIAYFPLLSDRLGWESGFSVSFKTEGGGRVNVYSDTGKSGQVLTNGNSRLFHNVMEHGQNMFISENGCTLQADNYGVLAAVEGIARSHALKDTRLYAVWKINQIELKAVLPLTILQMQMAVDGGKHEEEINFKDYGKLNSDGKTPGDFGSYRCVFWTNTDGDIEHYEDEIWPEPNAWHEDDGANVRNCDDDVIGRKAKKLDGKPKKDNYCLRDLEDFNRLQFSLDSLFTHIDGISFTLSGAPINVFEAVDCSLDYLLKNDKAQEQVQKKKIPSYNGKVQLSNDKLIFGVDARNAYIWEGCKAEAADLVLKALLPDGREIGRKKVRLVLHDISDYFDSWNKGLTNTNDATKETFESDKIRKKLGQSGNDYLLFVHGFNVSDEEKKTWPATIYKRLWWLGFKGRLGIFAWPCELIPSWHLVSRLPTNIYDNSDCETHKQGKNLADLLAYLDSGYCHGKVHILAHSQGNIVTGEALRMLSNHTISTYIATQAAVSLSNYEQVEQPYFEEPGYGKKGKPHSTPDVRARFPGCRMPAPYFSPIITGNRVRKRCNFYNAEDYALRSCDVFSWEDDNQMRPNIGYGYSGDADNYERLPDNQFDYEWVKLNFPDKPKKEDTFRWNDMKDTYEILSYAAEAWGKPLGIVSAVAGFTGNKDLQSLLGYDRYHYSHSRQFRSNIIAEKEYWIAVLTACNLIKRN